MKPWPHYISGSYPSQSPLADGERTINWYPEKVESPGGTSPTVLYPTPGQQPFTSVTDIGTRAIFSMNDRTFAVVGPGVYELFAGGTSIRRGTVAQDNYPATISTNGPGGGELFITSGSNGYILDLTTAVFTQVLTGIATMGGMIDGYFLAFDIAQSKVRLSNLLDGLTWDPTQFFQRSIAPDNWQAMVIGNREVWLIGSETGEVWYDATTFPQPFAPIPGAVFKYGTRAAFSVKVVGDSVVWLSQTDTGAGTVVQARGYIPTPISTHAVATQIENYSRAGTISDAEALVYADQGHTFYCLKFPSANATWVYDEATQLWHERGTWHPTENRFDAWHPRVHGYAFGKHLVGESATGTISVMDVTFGSEPDGSVIRRVRIAPGLFADDRWLFNARFQLVLEPGLGLTLGQGHDPLVMLRLSQDGGKTWSNERRATAGARGLYQTRVFWLRNGSAERPVVEVSVSDPVPWRLLNALVGLRAEAA